MNIYFIGIGGKAMGPLAEFAEDAGNAVFGSDLANSLMTDELSARNILVHIGEQNGHFLAETHAKSPIDWVVYTSALPDTHPELKKARELGLKTTKRIEFINFLIHEHGLQMIAVAGTHGKTTTTAMLAWVFQNLDVPASHLIGSPIDFAPSGKFTPNSKLFIYEADEYDRNFLGFHPSISLITTVDYDHADIYPSAEDYTAAFKQFCAQSSLIITWPNIAQKLSLTDDKTTTLDKAFPEITLPGAHNRENASLVFACINLYCITLSPKSQVFHDNRSSVADTPTSSTQKSHIFDILNHYPSAKQRFEKLANNLYSDYAHTPEEISATLQMAREIAKPEQKIITIYMPHSNARQQDIVSKGGYASSFNLADKIYWLPTLLARLSENENLLSPSDLIETLSPTTKPTAEPAEADENLIARIKQHLASGDFVIFFGTDDLWLRSSLAH